MVQVIQVSIRGVGRTINRFEQLRKRVPEIGARAVYNIARFSAKALKQEAMAKGIRHWGGGKKQLLGKDTRAKKIKKGHYQVVMPSHGVLLDKGNYFQTIRRGTLLAKWARERFGTKRITGRSRVYYGSAGGIIPGHSFIYVKPKPFIQNAIRRTRIKARDEAKKARKKIRNIRGR